MGTPSDRIVPFRDREPPPLLLPQHRKLLADSRIADWVIAARGYRSIRYGEELGELGAYSFSTGQRKNTPGLLIPIYNLQGEVVHYSYRPDVPPIDTVKSRGAGKTKYKKYYGPFGVKVPLDIPAWIAGQLRDPATPLWITEGARKVDSLVSQEFAAIGFTGVWAFKGERVTWEGIDLRNRQVNLIFDSDAMTKSEVQDALRAATKYLTKLGAEVSVVHLPHLPDGSKCGVDDYFGLGHTPADLLALPTTVGETKKQRVIAFPETPPPAPDLPVKEVVSERLNRRGQTRRDHQETAGIILDDLDQHGTRYQDARDETIYYYHDEASHRLIAIDWTSHASRFTLSSFGKKLYRDYDVHPDDHRVMSEVRAKFTLDAAEIDPLWSFHSTDDTLYVQASDTEVFKVTGHEIALVPNGTDGVIFRDGVVDPVRLNPPGGHRVPGRHWSRVIDQLSLDEPEILTKEQFKLLLECYVHLAPWFWKWRGLELPIMVCVGEGGSGKTRFWNVNLGVQYGLAEGMTKIKGMPRDLQEMRAHVIHTTGMLVFDNFKPGGVGNWRDNFEAELSRLVTGKGFPYRKLYSDKETVVTPRVIPVLTTTQMPMVAEDVIQRMLRVNFAKIAFGQEGNAHSQQDWDYHILHESPGRGRLFADMLAAASRFLFLAGQPSKWQQYDKQRTRLTGFDRALCLMAEALGGEELLADMLEIVELLPTLISHTQLTSDPAMETLQRFAIHYWRRSRATGVSDRFPVNAIIQYVENLQLRGEGRPSTVFQNPHRAGAYIRSRPQLVREQTGIYLSHENNAQKFYEIDEAQLRAALEREGGNLDDQAD